MSDLPSPFEHLSLSFEDDEPTSANQNTTSQPIPYIPPELWFHIFVMGFGSMKQLARMSRLNKSVYYYCWSSPAPKANFYLDRYGKHLAIEKLFATEGHKDPDFYRVLEILIQKGATFSYSIRNQCPFFLMSTMPDAVRNINLFYTCNPLFPHCHMRKRILQLGKVGRLDLFCAILQEDRSLVTRSRIIARLKEFDLFLITDKPIEPKNVDLLMLVEKDPSLEFSPGTITIFIENNYPAIAEEMISFHLEPSSNQLSEKKLIRIPSGICLGFRTSNMWKLLLQLVLLQLHILGRL
ncbi:hypothetical protein BCR33DRAFT_549967 [Rhizoclosmatium globosum]|uniref:F-box domain-containing protein n=1 Tax=Rhizoclosmatium globosum TaxID=329046 RepID=A0A1Y2B8J3_9FUNG|nr:hypothetical protein BCR33DRAFT_549967 [Rhizoclosmatium globosum]|eukprot:ORY31133.1 hypothetical protein BCR33DRAFT_549967 [Rhizoclosmatium globosum]